MTEAEYKEFCYQARRFFEAYKARHPGESETTELQKSVEQLESYNDDFKRMIAVAALGAVAVTDNFKEANKLLEKHKNDLATLVTILTDAGKVAGAIISAAAAIFVG